MSEIKFSGILKIIPSSEVIESLTHFLGDLPQGAVLLDEKNLHVTLVHQSLLKRYRTDLKNMEFPPAPEIKLSHELVRAFDWPRTSWVVFLENQEEIRSYVNKIMEMIGENPDPEPQREFHISLANLTGKPGDSVRFPRMAKGETMPLPIHEQWNEDARKMLVGRTITDARYMTTEDAKRAGWGRHLCGSLVITLDDGTKLFPSTDDEGNGPGALFVNTPGDPERYTFKFPVCTVRGEVDSEEAEARAHEEALNNECLADNYAPEYE